MSRFGKLLFVDSTAQLQKRGGNETQTLCYFDLETISDWHKIAHAAVSQVTRLPTNETKIFYHDEKLFFETKTNSNLFVSQGNPTHPFAFSPKDHEKAALVNKKVNKLPRCLHHPIKRLLNKMSKHNQYKLHPDLVLDDFKLVSIQCGTVYPCFVDDTKEARAAQVSMQVSNSEVARHLQIGKIHSKGEKQNVDRLITVSQAMHDYYHAEDELKRDNVDQLY